MRSRKCQTAKATRDFAKDKEVLRQQMASIDQEGLKIVFVDEVLFTKSTVQTRDFSRKGTNIEVNSNVTYMKPLSVVASISTDAKVEHLLIHKGSTNQQLFIKFLRQLRGKLANERVAVFMDNLRVHATKLVRATMDELDFVPVYNVRYMPDYNPIETVFATVKRDFKQQRLNRLVNGLSFSPNVLIRRAFRQVKPTNIDACIRASLRLIH